MSNIIIIILNFIIIFIIFIFNFIITIIYNFIIIMFGTPGACLVRLVRLLPAGAPGACFVQLSLFLWILLLDFQNVIEFLFPCSRAAHFYTTVNH